MGFTKGLGGWIGFKCRILDHQWREDFDVSSEVVPGCWRPVETCLSCKASRDNPVAIRPTCGGCGHPAELHGRLALRGNQHLGSCQSLGCHCPCFRKVFYLWEKEAKKRGSV